MIPYVEIMPFLPLSLPPFLPSFFLFLCLKSFFYEMTVLIKFVCFKIFLAKSTVAPHF